MRKSSSRNMRNNGNDNDRAVDYFKEIEMGRACGSDGGGRVDRRNHQREPRGENSGWKTADEVARQYEERCGGAGNREPGCMVGLGVGR